MPDAPIRARWDGEAFRPCNGFNRTACAHIPAGELVTLEINRSRSSNSHRHAFAELGEAWANLPEHLQDAPYAANPDAFRKHLLIVCGFSDVRTVVTGSKAEAQRLAALLTQLATEAHGYALTDIRDNVVTLRTPWSMTYRAMGREQFQQVKAALLDAASAMLETTANSIAIAA